jgi:hypothetical protein
MNTGVYQIKNTVNGKRYIGSTKSFSARFQQHRYALERNTHHSKKLQNAWNKYGSCAFVFEKVLVCSAENLLDYEQRLLDGYESASQKGYNQLCTAGSRQGTPHDEEVVSRMRLFQRSNRKKYAWGGEQLCVAEIAEKVGLPRDLLIRRIAVDGMDVQTAVEMPLQKRNQLFNGFDRELTLKDWVQHIGCSTGFLKLWLNKGLTIEECVDKHKRITVNELGRISGVNGLAFSARIRAGWSVGDALAEPVRNPLTMSDARKIREMAKTMPRKDIVKEYKIDKSTVGLIIRNITFKE